jgi:uncharacterized membrane protein YgcG
LETLKALVLEEMEAVLSLDGRPLWRTIEEAELYGELFNQCIGYHKHTIDNNVFYMACDQHDADMPNTERKDSEGGNSGGSNGGSSGGNSGGGNPSGGGGSSGSPGR